MLYGGILEAGANAQSSLGRAGSRPYRGKESDPRHAARRVVRGGGDRLARSGEGPAGGGRIGHPESLRFLRRTARGCGDRGDLQSAAQSSARAVVGTRGRGGKARAVRE